MSPSEDTDCGAAADPVGCKCARIGAVWAEVEAAMWAVTTASVLQRLDPHHSSVMAANATAQLEALVAAAPEQVPPTTTELELP